MTTLVVLDGATLVNDVGRYLTEAAPSNASPEIQRAYFTSWFDIDRLVGATLGSSLRPNPFVDLGTIVFHSLHGVGSSGTVYCLEDAKAIEPFWARQGAAPGTSTQLVHIKGTEERGIVTAIVVYLFETIDRWDDAVIFSRDPDYVPAIWALRRRGKRVFCSAPETEFGSPLVQACQTFLPWNLDFLRADRAFFEFLQPSGALEQWLGSDVARGQAITLTVFDGALVVSPSFGEAGLRAMTELLRPVDLYAEDAEDGLYVRARRPASAVYPNGEAITTGPEVLEGLRRYHFLFRSKRWHNQLYLS